MGALAAAEARVAAVADDPAARMALMAQLFEGPTGHAPQHGGRPSRRPGRRAVVARRAAVARFQREADRTQWSYLADEQRLGRWLDYGVIAPRLQRLYDWSAEDLREPRLLELIHEGDPIYAWPVEQRHVWRTLHAPLAARAIERVTRAR